jgi:hypothetical protein
MSWRAMILSSTFERIHFFLQRLKGYTEMPLTHESRELVGKIMAQLLSILALSTKVMTDNRISELIRLRIRKVSEEICGKARRRTCGFTIGYAHEGGEFNGDGEELGGYTAN